RFSRDWSSDVCSSDLILPSAASASSPLPFSDYAGSVLTAFPLWKPKARGSAENQAPLKGSEIPAVEGPRMVLKQKHRVRVEHMEIGRASGREGVEVWG